MPALYKCVHCRDNIEPVDGEWIGQLSRTSDCKHAPDKRHARQIVIGV